MIARALLAGFAVASAQTCDFPLPTPDLRCFGLVPSFTGNNSAQDCAQACCDAGDAACAAWQFCPAGATCQPQGISYCWIGQPTGSQLCQSGATGWVGGLRGTPPITGSYYAIVPFNLSTGLPGSYAARHCSSTVSCDTFPGAGANDDFSWRIVEAVTEDATAISLQPRNYYFDSLGITSSISGGPALGISAAPTVPAADLSWQVVPGLQNAAFFSLITTSTNPLYEGQYMTLSNAITVPCAYNAPFGDLVIAPPNSLVAGNGSMITQTFLFVPVSLPSSVLWTTDHHDAQNSGFSNWDGPGETAAVCHEQLIKDDPLDQDTTERFFATGVTSAVDGWFFVGSSDDTLYMLEDLLVATQHDDSWQGFSLDLKQVLSIASPATPYGIVGSPAVLFPPNYNQGSYDPSQSMVFVASADGWIAGISPLFCFTLGSRAAGQQQEEAARSSGSLTALDAALLRASVPIPAAGAARNLEAVAPLRVPGLRGAAASAPSSPHASPAGQWLAAGSALLRAAAVPSTAAPGGNLWALYTNLNAVQNTPPGAYYNSTTPSWPECQALCWDDFQRRGSLGDPDACVIWTWHDSSNGEYAYDCYFKTTAGFVAHPQKGHVSGVLTVSDPGPACVTWARQISAVNRPSYSSARVIVVGGQNVVLASETDASLDTGGVLHAYDAATGNELWNYAAMYNGNPYGLKGVVPAQMTDNVNPNILIVAYGPKVAALDMSVCSGGQACPEVSTFDSTGYPGGGDAFVSSPVLAPDGGRVFLHSSTGTLWSLYVFNNPVQFDVGWACRYSRSQPNVCTPPTETVEGVDSVWRPVRDYGVAGGWYQPTTRAERDELHVAIAEAHASRFGAAAGAVASPEEAASAVTHATRLAGQLPREELLAIVTPSGYHRKRADGKPGPGVGAADFGGLFPFATPAVFYEAGFSTAVKIATVDFQLSVDSGLFVVDGGTGVPVPALQPDGSSRPFAVLDVKLADGRVVPFGRSRSSPAFDRQQHVYVGTDTDFDGNPADNDTYPVLFCADSGANVKWAVGMGEERAATIGCASPVVTAGPRGDNRVYMVASDGVQSVIEAPTGQTCPASASGLLDCSGHGDCDCATGTCACDGCFADPACGTFNPAGCLNGGVCAGDGTCQCPNPCVSGVHCEIVTDCGHGGSCNAADGSCACAGCVGLNAFGLCNTFNATSDYCNGQACAAPGGTCACSKASCLAGPTCGNPLDCLNGGSCTFGTGACVCANCWDVGADGLCSVPNTCSSHGTCDAGSGACQCADGWSGPTCNASLSSASNTPTPTPAVTATRTPAATKSPAPAPAAATTGGSGGAIAAGILVPTALLAAAAGLFVYARRNPASGVAAGLSSAAGFVARFTSATSTAPSASRSRYELTSSSPSSSDAAAPSSRLGQLSKLVGGSPAAAGATKETTSLLSAARASSSYAAKGGGTTPKL